MSTIRHMMVYGRVQGVGFRAFVEFEAIKFRIGGWVRNRRDGSVEALFSGEDEVVAAVIAACRKGPLGSRIDALYEREGTAEDLGLKPAGETFSVLPTA
jgi:acylphosphatase